MHLAQRNLWSANTIFSCRFVNELVRWQSDARDRFSPPFNGAQQARFPGPHCKVGRTPQHIQLQGILFQHAKQGIVDVSMEGSGSGHHESRPVRQPGDNAKQTFGRLPSYCINPAR